MSSPVRKPAKHLTVRGVPDDIARALDDERRRRGDSLNATVIDLLRRALGLSVGKVYTNGLEKLAGGWSDADLAEFETATAVFEQVDEDLWK